MDAPLKRNLYYRYQVGQTRIPEYGGNQIKEPAEEGSAIFAFTVNLLEIAVMSRWQKMVCHFSVGK